MIEKREKIILIILVTIWAICGCIDIIVKNQRIRNIEKSLQGIEESLAIKKGGVDDGN